MLLFCIAILGGLAVLVWSADRFVTGAVATALNLGMTPMMVGLTVVAFGTSAPELIVSATAALEDASNLAVGNAIGSNIANIGLVLGVTALVSAIPLKATILKVEFPILLIATALATALIWDLHLSPWDGVGLALILIASMVALAKLQKEPVEDLDEIEESRSIAPTKAYMILAGSLILLLASSKALVWGASGIATTMGVSELVIGLTIVAIGTSLPELAASIASALKGHHDLALGNVIGSNLFNLLAVLAIPALLNPPTLEEDALFRDYGLMLGLTVGLAVLAYVKRALKVQAMGKFV
ncbi:MAG: calcium/sodium antiporter, partial [Oleiphilaceae bacterium]|nr:calcium/sodium antiporter [Oleiphilaceae bacterium]